MNHFDRIGRAASWATNQLLLNGEMVDSGRWQGVPTEGKPDLMTREVVNLSFSAEIPMTEGELVDELLGDKLNLPWAENHFQERVSRFPSNPGYEYQNWPWWHGQEDLTQDDGIFTHTYMERFWAHGYDGINFTYGDLDDVVELLRREPHTRQATFPIFFPEDTGAVHGGRIPCTLHYHFLLRNGKLHLWYPIRSCDAVRHFYDDLYMACRLSHWVLQELVDHELRSDEPQMWVDVDPGELHFTAYSFHVHMGDYHLL